MSKTKYILILIIFTAFVFESCKKRHPDEFREPFTNEQLGWINNLENPVYRRVLKTTDSIGNTIYKIDTLKSRSEKKVYFMNDVINDEYIINYYEGNYSVELGINPIEFNTSFITSILINNYPDFKAEITAKYIYRVSNYQTQSIQLNNVIYDNVYVIENVKDTLSESIKKLVYKKELGFIYMEKVNGNNITLIENTAKSDRFLKPVRFN
jgi:hypothetical protein